MKIPTYKDPTICTEVRITSPQVRESITLDSWKYDNGYLVHTSTLEDKKTKIKLGTTNRVDILSINQAARPDMLDSLVLDASQKLTKEMARIKGTT